MLQAGKITALYCRLSQEDMQAGESESIQNHKDICKELFQADQLTNQHSRFHGGRQPRRRSYSRLRFFRTLGRCFSAVKTSGKPNVIILI